VSERKKYDLEQLRELLRVVEATGAGDRRVDAALHDFFGFTKEDHCRDWCRGGGRTDLTRAHYLSAWAKYFTTSRDDATLLFELVLPGHGLVEGKGRLRLEEPLFGAVVYADLTTHNELGAAEGDISARVLCVAILRALIAIEEAAA
jgi:hypothetical protein